MTDLREESRPPRVDFVVSRPRTHNAITAPMMDELVSGVRGTGVDDNVKAVVIRSEGAVFTSGFDIGDTSNFAGSQGDPVRERIASLAGKADWMRQLFHAPKPSIVQVQGLCIGIGTMLVVTADFAVASEEAAFGFPEERFGSAGSTWAYPFLAASVGLKRANEILMTGRRVEAAEMQQMGLINRVVSADRLAEEVDSLVDALASLPRDGIAVNRAAKRLATGALGYDQSFDSHAVVHPLVERVQRSDDEYDFMQSVGQIGMRSAVAERNERFGGSWWGW